MRRASTWTSLIPRTIAPAGSTLAAGGGASASIHGRLFQASLYGSLAEASAHRRRYPFFSWSCSRRVAALGFVGTLASVAGAGLLFEDVYAKEVTPPMLRPREVVLYQYEACPFCNKVKAFLDYYHIQYEVVEVNPLSKQQIKWSDYKKVPILMVDGEPLVDSSVIIDKLYNRICSKESAVDPDTDDNEGKWRKWVDNHLVHVLSPNIYRNTTEALEAFDYITKNGNFNFTERFTVKYAGAAAMYFVSKKLKKKYNITDERAALYEAAETWMEALNGQDYLGGSKPNLADLAVFGVLRPIRYLQAGRDMVEHTRIGEWYLRMEEAVGHSARAGTVCAE